MGMSIVLLEAEQSLAVHKEGRANKPDDSSRICDYIVVVVVVVAMAVICC